MSEKENFHALKNNKAHAHLNFKNVVMSFHFMDMSDYK